MKKMILLFCLLGCIFACTQTKESCEIMMYSDSTYTGVAYSKDPHVVKFNDRYLLYYSNHQKEGGLDIGIAESKDLIHWTRVGEITPDPNAEYEKKGFCAPCARVIDGKVHLFYQSYGNFARDAICHAISEDGINFVRDSSNPIFSPEPSDWTCGRAIDAEVYKFKGQYFLYFATRDTSMKYQIQGVAVADGNTDFSRGQWHLGIDSTILAPEYEWEDKCIEGASIIERDGKLFMFYAGAYNNHPQQIGVAESEDGIHWTRLSEEPFLKNGKPGEWNASESGHPHIFEDEDHRTYLFYQGNNTNGANWYLSQVEIIWPDGKPQIK